MISKKEFISIISEHRAWENKMDKVQEVLGIVPFDIDFIEYSAILFEKLLDFIFEPEGTDTICWWLWEKNNRSEYKMYDKDDREIPMETIDNLWDYVKEYQK